MCIGLVRDMTHGSPLRLILGFALPMAIGNIFQQFYSMADTIIVGKFIGVDALASVGSTGSLNFLILGFVLGVCNGFAIPISQCFGAGDLKGMRRCVANSIYLGIGIAVIFTLVTLLFTRQFLTWMKTPQDIFEGAYDYIIVIFGGMFSMMLFNLLSGFMRALGDSRTPLLFLVISSITNIVLDLVFILVFHSGVAGAAWATVISQGLSGVLCLGFIARKVPMLHLTREDMKLDMMVVVRLLRNGIPMALQFSITAVGSIILQTAVNTLGSTVVAAITAGDKVQSLVTQPMDSLGATSATYCGQNLGAERIDRIHAGFRRFVAVAVIYSLFAAFVVIFFGTKIALLFLSGSETTILGYVHQYLLIDGLFFIPLSFIFIFRNGLQGMGLGLSAMLAGICELVARASVAFTLVPILGYVGACISNPAAWVAADLLLIPMYFYVMRKLDARYKAKKLSQPAPAEQA